MKLGCVVLAAGEGKRFGGNKLMQQINGEPMITRTLSVIPVECFTRVVVVTQRGEIETIVKEYGFPVIINDHPESGQSLSLRLGLEAMTEQDGVMFLVADQPMLQCDSIKKLVSCFEDHPDRIVALGHYARRGNPCLFPARFFPELMAVEGDRGGNVVIRSHPEALLLCEIQNAEELTDVDTPRELKLLQK